MILDRFRLDGKTALVTGGTRGIGRAIVEGFTEAGADVAVVSRAPNSELAEAVTSMGRRYLHHSADLSDRNQTRKVVSTVIEAMGGLDILVNNSGVIPRSPAEEFTEDDWDATIEVNLSATFLLCQEAGKYMIQNGKGKIINTASILAFQGGINVLAYTASKHGITGLTKTLANEWASKGINVNAIAPGYIVTGLTAALEQDPVRGKNILNRIPTGRWGQPEDIAGAALFLASPASDFVNGTVLTVDGVWMAW